MELSTQINNTMSTDKAQTLDNLNQSEAATDKVPKGAEAEGTVGVAVGTEEAVETGGGISLAEVDYNDEDGDALMQNIQHVPGWKVVRLGEVADIKTGSKNNQDKSPEGKYPFYVRSATIEYIDTFSYDCEAILIPGEGGVGHIFHYADGKFEVHQRVYAISGFHQNAYAKYVYYYMSKHFGNHATAHSVKATVDSLRLPTFKEFYLELPPLDEQIAIANALSDVDDLITKLSQLIDKKSNIKKGTMQELLTGKRRLPRFNEEWKTVRLGEVASAYGGLSGKSKKDFLKGNSYYIPFTNVIRNTTLDVQHLEPVLVSSSELQNKVINSDLIFNGSSETPDELGLCMTVENVEGPLYLNSFCFGVRFKPAAPIYSLFLAYYFRSDLGRKIMSKLAQGSTRYNLSKTKLLTQAIVIPSLDEQIAIANILSDMDVEIEALKAKRDKLILVKQGMMQQLLTGKIRLV